MIGNKKNRIARLESGLNLQKALRILLTYSKQQGSDGEVIREETDEQLIARHIAECPEYAGLNFAIMNIVWVSPKGTCSGGR